MQDQQGLGLPRACGGLSARRSGVFWVMIAFNLAIWVGVLVLLLALAYV